MGILAEQILIIDKEPDTVEVVRTHLEQTGFQVATTKDAETAMHLIHQQMPDLKAMAAW